MSVSKPHTCGFNADFLITRARCIEDVGETRQPIRPCLLVIRDFRGDGRQANVACRLSVNANRHKLQQSSRVCVTNYNASRANGELSENVTKAWDGRDEHSTLTKAQFSALDTLPKEGHRRKLRTSG